MKFNKYKLFSLGLLFGILCGSFLLFGHVFAQPDLGLNEVGDTLGLPQTDIRIIIANIIKVALSLLGIVALVLVLYGGFVWMTAGGNADKVAQAKKILVNAVIGLVIIFSAYAIVSFVMSKLIEATSDYPSHCFNGIQDEGEEGIDCGGGCTACGGGVVPGAENVFYVQQKPSGDVCVRNFYAIVVFNRPVSLASLSGNLVIRKISDESVASGSWQFVSDTTQNAIKFVPDGDCGDGTSDCLEPSTEYELEFVSGSSIQSQDSLYLSCSMGVGCNSTQFTTGEGIDREPPTIIIEYPNNGERLEQGVVVATDIVFTDDNGVQNISLYADGNFIESESISGCVQTGRVQLDWPTAPMSLGDHVLRAVGWDYSSAQDDDVVTVNIQPSHCFNNVMDEDETGIDCGGVCGSCGGESCTSDEQCASGYCEILEGETEGVCVDKMQITNVSPLSGAPDTYVTISGRYFGQTKGIVYMTAESGGWVEAPIVSCGVDYNNWTDAQIVISVPDGAGDGPVRVDTGIIVGSDGVERQFTDTTNDSWGPNFIFDVNNVIRPGLCLLDPNTGPPYSTTVEILGQNFGDSTNNPSSDNIWFGDFKAIINNWSDVLIRAKVPGLGRGPVGVTAENDGVKGNSLRFYVSEDTNVDSPVIYSITPNHGARGEYVTISGDNFGNNIGKVILKQKGGTGLSTEGNFDFPAECDGAVWTNEQIVFKIPDSIALSSEYSVQVQTASTPTKLSPIGGYFSTESGSPSPGLCKIDPISGPIPFVEGKNMSFYGEYFTDNNVSVPYFWSLNGDANSISGRVPTTEFLSWWDRELIVRPPVGAISGPVVVNRNSDGKFSNPLSFSVFDCVKNDNTCTTDGYKCCTLGADAGVCRPEGELCEGETRSTGYMWRFSTRDFPLVPRVLENCNGDTDMGANLPSPAPSTQWNSGNNDHTNVCRNALVTVGFTSPISQASVNSGSVHVYRCTADASGEGGVVDNRCRVGETAVVLTPDSYSLKNFSDGTNNYFYLSILPSSRVWEDNSWYQVVLDNDIESVLTVEEGSYNLKEDRPCGTGTAYCFVFRTDSSDCRMSRVVITPFSYWTSILEEPVKYRVLRNNANDSGSDLYYTANGLSDQHCIWMDTNEYTWAWSSDNPAYAPIYGVRTDYPNQAQVSALANTVGVGLPGDNVGIRATASRAGLSFSTSSPLTIDLSTPEVVDYWPNCLEACLNAELGVRFNLAMSNKNLATGIRLYRCNDENCLSTLRVSVSATVNPADRREISFTPVGGFLAGELYEVFISSSSSPNLQLWSVGSASDISVLGKAYEKEFVWRFRTKKEACALDRVVVTPSVFYAPYITARTVFGANAYSSPDQCRATGQRLDPWGMQWSWSSSDSEVATVSTFNTRGESDFCTTDCLLKGSEVPYGVEFNEPVCGNGVLEAGEDCDNPSQSSGCSLNCLLINKTNTGSSAQTEATDVNASICGNGMIGEGEDCDLGIEPEKDVVTSAMNCSKNCLHLGSRLSASWCANNKTSFGGFDYSDYIEACRNSISQCGDGLVAPNEDPTCESGGFDSNVCTENCLLIQECSPYDPNNQEAGYLEGCSLGGKFLGSSLMYSTPSVCGDGVTGLGEHPNCEATINAVHTFTDPWTLVIGKGNGVLSGDPPSQQTTILAEGTDQSSGTQRSDTGEFIIQCGYTNDYECNQNVAYCGPSGCGVGDDSCCYPRPAVIATYPASTTPITEDVCPNTYIEVVFDKKIDPLSLAGNVYLARLSDTGDCESGEENVDHLVSLDMLYNNAPWYKKIWYKAVILAQNIRDVIFEKVFAQSKAGGTTYTLGAWCSGSELATSEVLYEPLPAGVEEINTVSRVFIRLQKPLAYDNRYAVVLRPGVRDIDGVSIGSNVKWKFETDSDMCLLDSLSVVPDEYLFDELDESVNLQAVPETFDNRVIQPVPGYNWAYLWGPENNDYVFLNTTTRDIVLATTRNRNGEIDMTVNVDFIENIFSNENPELSATTKLTTFICENPWPARVGSTEVKFNETVYDFSTYYCMDSGVHGVGDDLPFLNRTVKTAGSPGLESGVLRKYIFSTDDVSDAIGITILSNPNKESVYNLLTVAGFQSYQKMELKGYDAITDGYNIYTDAVARSSSGVPYSNIYLFSLNQNAGPEMRNIFDQMIQNLEFNIFADNIEYCGVRSTGNTLPNFERPCKTDLDCALYSDTKVCLNIKDKITRNYTRFKDLRETKNLIEDYKVETGNSGYPTLSENTYLSGQAMSVWPSAWNELSSSVGILPVDPINKLRSSGTCYLDTTESCVSDDDCGVVPASDNLIGLWLANNSTRNEKNNGDGTIVGTVNYTPGKGSGEAFDFSGENESYIDIPHNDAFSPSANFSISLWFKPTKQSPAVLFKKGGLGLNNEGLGGFELSYSGQSFAGGSTRFNNGTIRFAVYNDAEDPTYYVVDSSSPLELNKWHNVTAVFAGGSMTITIDGTTFSQKYNQDGQALGNVSNIMVQNTEDIKIGQSLNGAIDNIYYYVNFALPSSYVTGLYNHLCVFHDENTGWSTEDFRFSFACNTDSLAYRYVYNSASRDYTLRAKMEDDGFLIGSSFISVNSKIIYDGFGACLNTDEISSPSSLICGDGIVGSGESCDPPGAELWDISGCPTSRAVKKVCSNSCSWSVIPSTGTAASTCRGAVGGTCGDGEIQYLAGEKCDDGELNGQIWRCKSDCSGIENTKCGNGVLDSDAGELCDPTVDKDGKAGWCIGGPYTFDPENPDATFVPCNSNSECSTNQCYITNVKYAKTRDASCNWDCKTRGPYCGDTATQGEWGEDCDGDVPCILPDGRDGRFSCLSTCRKDNSTSRDMIALWEFDSIGPNGEVYDTIGNYDGSCKSGECPDIVEGKHAGNPAFDFMGQTRLVTINDKDDKTMSNPPFSYEMWFKPVENAASNPRLLEKGGRDVSFGTSGATGRIGGPQILFYPGINSKAYFYSRYYVDNKVTSATYINAAVSLDAWHHLIVAFDPTSIYTPTGLPADHTCWNGVMYIYLDGNLETTNTNGKICNTDYPLCFGVKCNVDGNVDYDTAGNAYSFKGAIEDIAFYNKVIDKETIGDHANGGGWYCTAYPDDYYEDDPSSSDYVAYCGNGIMDEDEVCDVGDNNGVPCNPATGSRCSYCAYDCQSILTMERY